ncbi:MAG TPA: hypothetical protein PLB18_23100, partial [Acidobacteriota bacterium]|nr:hypothetical protein [Acidobacteriota bacterium]
IPIITVGERSSDGSKRKLLPWVNAITPDASIVQIYWQMVLKRWNPGFDLFRLHQFAHRAWIQKYHRPPPGLNIPVPEKNRQAPCDIIESPWH